MLRYKSDLLLDANNGQGKVTFKASRIECPCIITSPNIDAIQARLDRLDALSSSSASPAPAPAPAAAATTTPDLSLSQITVQQIEQIRADIVTLLARQDALDAIRTSLEEKLAARSAPAPPTSPTNPVFNARLNTISDDVSRLSTVIERIERRLAAIEANLHSSVEVAPAAAAPAALVEDTVPPPTTDEVKRITTPDGRVITLRRTQPTKTTAPTYAW